MVKRLIYASPGKLFIFIFTDFKYNIYIFLFQHFFTPFNLLTEVGSNNQLARCSGKHNVLVRFRRCAQPFLCKSLETTINHKTLLYVVWKEWKKKKLEKVESLIKKKIRWKRMKIKKRMGDTAHLLPSNHEKLFLLFKARLQAIFRKLTSSYHGGFVCSAFIHNLMNRVVAALKC